MASNSEHIENQTVLMLNISYNPDRNDKKWGGLSANLTIYEKLNEQFQLISILSVV